ncbi:MAG: Mov34/MPN/PAD-1 family protein [Nitrososphaerales archaeon]
MLEAAVIINEDHNPIYWHCPNNRSSYAIPDSPDIWRFIWRNRDEIFGIAHTHPGTGYPSPSQEDVTTFSAIEKALGRRLQWWIATEDQLSLVTYAGPTEYAYAVLLLEEKPEWLDDLRNLSQ